MHIAFFSFYFDIRKVNARFQIELLFSRFSFSTYNHSFSFTGKNKQGHCLPPRTKHFFSEDITEDHEVSRPKSTEFKSRDKYTLSFILRFQSKMFTRNELHWKKLENAEFILIIK